MEPEDSDIESEELHEIEHLDPKEVNDLLFLVQSLGCPKKIANVETYVKNEDCIDFLKELYKILRNENPDSTLKRLELGEWNVVQSDLLQLIVSYPEDRQLAFYTILLLASLTEKPEKNHFNIEKYTECLQKYKLSFINSKETIRVIVNHLAECLSKQEGERNEQHEQMLELIVYLFRNLLVIPDNNSYAIRTTKSIAVYNSCDDSLKDLQRRLLHKFADETVLEALVFMSQDMTHPVMKKVNLAFLEIMHHIFKFFKPAVIWAPVEEKSLLQKLIEKEEEANVIREVGSRHSKFGSTIVETREFDGSQMIVSNPFAERVAYNKIPKQLLKVKRRSFENMKSLPELTSIDRSLIEKIKYFGCEVLEHSFCPLIESVFVEFYKDSERLVEDDRTAYFLFQAYIFEFYRRKLLFENEKIEIDASLIGDSLKLQNFEYLYRSLLMEAKKSSKKEFKTAEFEAGLKFLTQFFYVVKEMSDSEDENTKRNGHILMQNIFYHEVTKICRRAFDFWYPGVNDIHFLQDIVELNHICFNMLDSYTQGKEMKVRTERLKKKKERGDESDDYLNEGEQERYETVYYERSLAFTIELCTLLDPEIISKYLILLRRFKENSEEVNLMITTFFERVMKTLEASWIFFELDYLTTFDEILSDPSMSISPKFKPIKDTLNSILTAFFTVLESNKLIVVESLFRIKDKHLKNLLLSNYEEPVITEEEVFQKRKKMNWTKEDDLVLLDNYDTFKDMDRVFEILAGLVKNKSIEQVEKRVKRLRLEKGVDAARESFKKIYIGNDAYNDYGNPRCFAEFGKTTVLEILKKIHQLLEEFWDSGGGTFEYSPGEERDLVFAPLFSSFLISIGFREEGSVWKTDIPPMELFEVIQGYEDEEAVGDEEEMTYGANEMVF